MYFSLTTEDIIEIHEEIIEEFGGEHGIVSKSSLEFIVVHSKNNKFEEDFFTLLTKILRAITIDHPFIDGNKRTGLVVIESILQENNLILNLSEKEKEQFILKVANLEYDEDKLKIFLESNSFDY